MKIFFLIKSYLKHFFFDISAGVCLVESESSYETNVIGPRNSDGSYVWGPFQIKDRYWCNGFYPNSGNVCGINCSGMYYKKNFSKSYIENTIYFLIDVSLFLAFLSGDIFNALSCAVKIYNIHGYSAWEGWRIRCQGKHFSLADCGNTKLSLSIFLYIFVHIKTSI